MATIHSFCLPAKGGGTFLTACLLILTALSCQPEKGVVVSHDLEVATPNRCNA